MKVRTTERTESSGSVYVKHMRLVGTLALMAIVTGSCAAPASTPVANVPSSSEAQLPTSGGPTPAGSTAHALGRFPAPPTGTLPTQTASALQAILDRAVPALPGVSATVIVADRGTWSGAAGLADDEHPVQVGSQFGIASITKTVIAAEIMLLAEQGRLRLSDQVSVHLPPDFTFDTNGATIRDLLAMESGIPDPALDNTNYASDLKRSWNPREVLATVPEERSKPGDHFVYGDANYMLLGMVVAQVTGESVATALRSGVLADPRFARLVFQPEERPAGPFALPHVGGKLRSDILERGGGYLPSEAEASEGNGSGCMASDSGTLALWGYQLFGGAILPEHSVLAMTDFGADQPNGSMGPYGLGVFDQTNLANGYGVPTVGNGGWDDGGYSAVLSVIPGEGIAIAVLANTAGDPKALVMPLAQQMVSLLRRVQ